MFTKNFVFSLFAVAFCATTHADVTVLNTINPDLTDGQFNTGTVGFGAGTFIAESFVTGSSILTLSNVVFPQITQNQEQTQNFDSYSSTEQFGLYANSTLSGTDRPAPVALFNFTLQNDPSIPVTNPATFGETTATVPLIDVGLATLLRNTRYWLVLTDPGSPLTNPTGVPLPVAWNYTIANNYTSALGFSLPLTNTTITDDPKANPVEFIGSLSDGPQQFVLNVVPEPSTYCLMAVAGLALVVSRKRTRKVA